MNNDWIELSKKPRGFQPGQRVKLYRELGYKYGTVMGVQHNPYGQEEAVVQFDDLPCTVLILTINLSPMEDLGGSHKSSA